MPSQTFVVLGVEDDHAEIRYNDWQIIDSLVLLHCATTSSSSPKPTLLTCLAESTLRALSEYPKIILGDPSCERLQLSYPENINVVTSISSDLKTNALIRIRTAAVGEGETLIIILCGHGDIEGKFLIGSGEGVCRQLAKEELQASVRTCKGQVTVITTACHGGLWTSELWDLVAAAPASQESDSIVASESGQYRGGIFTSALLTEHDSQAGIAMPRPGVTTISEFCGSHKVNESCTSCRLNAPLSDPEAHNTDVLVSEMNNFRLSLNRPLYSASFGHHGDRDSIFPFDGPTLLSITPFTKVKPNPAKSTSVGQSGIQNVQTVTHQHHVNVDIEGLEDAPWTLTEEQEMQNLAIAVKQEVLATVPSNLFVMRSALWYLAGGEKRRTVQSIKNKKPLVTLRKHEALREQARIIASTMGWDISIDPAMAVGPVDAALIQEACDVGECDVNVVTFEGKWREPAYWLARLWKAAGGVAVDRSIWDKAVSSAQQQS
ncbi:hypothetical protein ARMSODRAFT_946857 [Armillaria solidipes]|uniref:Uncharacterized protein n=1 Tax=Armillaria solidipes TaxID=1076256 RepID=A0A2H3C9K7_9AGAR|nr:hypothetical protein ARMSODRAFT_946857 [Armillaria solidipes]